MFFNRNRAIIFLFSQLYTIMTIDVDKEKDAQMPTATIKKTEAVVFDKYSPQHEKSVSTDFLPISDGNLYISLFSNKKFLDSLESCHTFKPIYWNFFLMIFFDFLIFNIVMVFF